MIRLNKQFRKLMAAPPKAKPDFQSQVLTWSVQAFGSETALDRTTRNHRFFEEAAELVQACGMTAQEAYALVDYVYGREVGELGQEVGGVMVTLAALCNAYDVSIQAQAEREWNRINTEGVMAKIAAKSLAKPKFQVAAAAPSADTAIHALLRLFEALDAAYISTWQGTPWAAAKDDAEAWLRRNGFLE